MTELVPDLPPELWLPAAHDARPRYAVCARGTTWALQIWGVLPSGWCGRLAIHCYGAELSIEQGDARRIRAGRWVGAFRLRPLRGSARPEAFDFVRMALRRPVLTLDPRALPLRRLQLSSPPRSGGPARLSLEADDELGLLAHVLGCCDAVGLEPTRMSLRTQSNVACDRFWLCAANGGTPGEAVLERLRGLLLELEARR